MELGAIEALRTLVPSSEMSVYIDALKRYTQTGEPEPLWFYRDDTNYYELLSAMGLDVLDAASIAEIYYENISGYIETVEHDRLPYTGLWPTISLMNEIADRQSHDDFPNNFRASIVYNYDDSTCVVMGTEVDEQPRNCADCAHNDERVNDLSFGFSCEHDPGYDYTSNRWIVVVSKEELGRVNLASGTIED